MDQWDVGRQGFDDGLVIFFDIDETGRHGQVQLYAGPGFEAAFLSNSERQAIFENDMLPFLRSGDFDGALSAALAKVDAAATPEHAAAARARPPDQRRRRAGRRPDRSCLGLVGWALFHWRRFGKDPVYLDDPSVLMPAPPPDLTAASGAMVMDGGTSRRALTTAMLDLASRGLISFREDEAGSSAPPRRSASTSTRRAATTIGEAQRARNARRPIGPAEEVALHKLRRPRREREADFITPEDLPKFGTSVADVRQGARGPRRRARLVRRDAEQGVVALGRSWRARDRRRRRSR